MIGFAIPYAAEKRVHVLMEMVQQLLGKRMRQGLYILVQSAPLESPVLHHLHREVYG